MFALFSLSFGAIAEDDVIGRFKQYLTTFNKTYGSEDETLTRLVNFKVSDSKIKALNALRTSDTDAKFGHTYFSDYSNAEFTNMLGFKRVSQLGNVPVAKDFKGAEYGKMASVDWRNEGKVTAVKNQADCGSCWAFSAVEGVESAALMENLSSAGTKLSEQQVVSCDTTSYGCQGGDLVSAFQYIQSAGGLDSEASYPYTSGADDDSGSCQNIRDYVKGTDISSYTYATNPCDSGSCDDQNEDNLASTLSTKGPISICLNASQWQYYTGGVMSASQCGGCAADQMDHCVQLVGMQTSSNYWIVRNSWSTGWGDEGYIYLEMGKNACGVANEALYVTLPQ